MPKYQYFFTLHDVIQSIFKQVRISTDSCTATKEILGVANRSVRDSIEDELNRYMLEPLHKPTGVLITSCNMVHEATTKLISLTSLWVFSQLKLVLDRKRWRMDAGRVERVIFLRCNKLFNV